MSIRKTIATFLILAAILAGSGTLSACELPPSGGGDDDGASEEPVETYEATILGGTGEE